MKPTGMQAMVTEFATTRLQSREPVIAPDGSSVRSLLRLPRSSVAHFELAAGRTSCAITHRTVDEIWFVLSGSGEMWRKQGEREEIVALEPGVCLTVPLGTHFQFRASAAQGVAAIAVTLPPWSSDAEAIVVEGRWPATAR
jgi:mannose-6-phosphate isomerase-like protein (cupin superfamily)